MNVNIVVVKKTYSIPSDYILLSLLFVIGFLLSSFINANDWDGAFYEAGHNFLNPYSVYTFMNPPWLLLVLTPLTIFPYAFSQALNLGITFLVFGALLLRLKANPISFVLFFLSFPFLLAYSHGTVEWLPALAWLLPPQVGIWLVSVKPQAGGLVAVEWFLKSKKRVKLLAILGVTFLVSLLVWGFWVPNMMENVHKVQREGMQGWNLSLFPYLIPLGVAMWIYILWKRPSNSELLAMLSTYCFVPYFAWSSLALPLALVSAKNYRIALILWTANWLFLIVRSYHGQAIYTTAGF